jgi:hypothetical protein
VFGSQPDIKRVKTGTGTGNWLETNIKKKAESSGRIPVCSASLLFYLGLYIFDFNPGGGGYDQQRHLGEKYEKEKKKEKRKGKKRKNKTIFFPQPVLGSPI